MRALSIALALFPALASGAAATPEGRWEGLIQIPGRELSLIVDLKPESSGRWTGSMIIPGLGIKGASLSDIGVSDTDVQFGAHALLAGSSGPATFKAHLTAPAAMTGEMKQAGNVANFSLKQVGPAQVESPPHSTMVARELEDEWHGEFELGGYPRHVTVTLENHANTGATARFVVVGKKTNDLPVDLVIQEGVLLRIESQATQVNYEGRFFKESGEIRGSIELGSMELPLTLRRAAGGKS